MEKFFLSESAAGRLFLSFILPLIASLTLFQVHVWNSFCHGGEMLHSIYHQKDKYMNSTIKITVGSSIFRAVLADNASAFAFKAMLPLKISMNDVNGNEKYYRMPGSLTASAVHSGTIQAGDLMLWGDKGLVLFYKSFSSSYSYTPLGHIDNAAGLAAALGAGNVDVTFELE